MRLLTPVLVFGSILGSLCTQDVPSIHQSWQGATANGRLGQALAVVGDIDQDGVADFVIGAPSSSFAAALDNGRVLLISGASAKLLGELKGAQAYEHFGYAVAGLGDVDGDQVPDYAIGAPRLFLGSQQGSVFVYSGKTGKLLREILAPSTLVGAGFATSVAGAGDVDKDGVPDLLIGAPTAKVAGKQAGQAFVYSGKDGHLIHTVSGTQGLDRLGESLADAGDVDGDGFEDFLVGAPQKTGSDAGFALLVSGRTGAPIRKLQGDAAGDFFGLSVDGGSDLDGDTVPDQVVGAPQTDSLPVGGGGYLRAFSGKTGKVLYTSRGSMLDKGFGRVVCLVGDVDGDRVDDIAASTLVPVLPSSPGIVRILSGTDGNLFQEWGGSDKTSGFGAALAAAGDIDGDGIADLLVGEPALTDTVLERGAAHLVSAWPLDLTADATTISLSRGGRIQLELDPGPAQAGRVFVILGSGSGIHPGLQVQGLHLPLAVDGYFSLLLGAPNSLILPSVGVLDATGTASAGLALPPGMPVSLAGTVLHHAFLVLDAAPFRVERVSNPVRLELIR